MRPPATLSPCGWSRFRRFAISSARQVEFWRAVFDHLIPQYDRTPDRRIPIVEPLDERLYQNRTIGYRYETMPP